MDTNIIDCLTSKLGITLTAMQQAVTDAMLNTKRNLVVLSPTGSGKTYAYLLPLVQLLDANSSAPQAVIVLPSRELAQQSARVLNNLGCGMRAMALYGGRPTMDEHRLMRTQQPQILFGTPGRLNDHIDKGNLDVSTIKWLVIDEYDKCLEMGFQAEMEHLQAALTAIQRKVLLSATQAVQIPKYMGVSAHDKPLLLNHLPSEEQIPERICVQCVACPEMDKLPTLDRLLRHLQTDKSIVFLNFRDAVERVATYLQGQGYVISMLHGGLDQRQREQALYRFANGSTQILVSTDLASRGLDIPDVNNVIHYHFPENADAYVHRVGRTARWDKTGRTFFLLNPKETIPEYVDAETEDYALPEALPTAIPQPQMSTIYIGKGKKDKISKGDIVGYLCKAAGISASDIGRIDVMPRYAYVAVKRTLLRQIINLTRGVKIKGIRTIVEEIK